MTRKPTVVANWKMNQTLEEIENFFVHLQKLSLANLPCRAWIAPQTLHLYQCLQWSQKYCPLPLGAQNINQNDSGAFTGENSPLALKELGASFALIGHSERRSLYGEKDDLLNQKTLKALERGLDVIFCLGETLKERESKLTFKVIQDQIQRGLKNIDPSQQEKVLIAYEPVWAIGTGKTATPQQAQEVHQYIRQTLSSIGFDSSKITLLYGGSVKANNFENLLHQRDVDGALVGGASLKAESFVQLCQIGSNSLLH